MERKLLEKNINQESILIIKNAFQITSEWIHLSHKKFKQIKTNSPKELSQR